jgi:hypothetical protein
MEACCEKPENRSVSSPTERPDLTVTTCLVCGRRHFELAVDPAVIGVKIGSGES